MQIWKSANIFVLYENNILKISHQNTFYFMDVRTLDMWKVCLQIFRNQGLF